MEGGAVFCGLQRCLSNTNINPAAIWEWEKNLLSPPPAPQPSTLQSPSTRERLDGEPGRSLTQKDEFRGIKNKNIFISIK